MFDYLKAVKIANEAARHSRPDCSEFTYREVLSAQLKASGPMLNGSYAASIALGVEEKKSAAGKRRTRKV